MKLPKNLKHKPIISINDYDQIDTTFYEGDPTDARALSIGLAQWESDLSIDERRQLSLKVWRHTGVNWSRQSEELPIHRNLDLTIFLLSFLASENQVHYPEGDVEVTVDISTRRNEILQYRESIEPRLKELKRLLNKIV